MNRRLNRMMIALLLAIAIVHPLRAAEPDRGANDYKVSAQDILIVSVVGEKDLTYECRVSSSGTISYAWLSNVEVAGQTPADIEQKLRTLLDKDYLVEPTVLVSIKEYNAREVTVMGQVNKPGAVTIPAEQGLTIVEAIARAGSIAKGGDPNKIYFTRRGKEKVKMTLEKLSKVTNRDEILVQPGDVIDVAEKVF